MQLDYLNINTAETASQYELQQKFQEELDEQYPDVDVCGGQYAAGAVLRWADPERFRMLFAHWKHRQGWSALYP